MSLINISIQANNYLSENENYDIMNTLLEDDDQIESRCGEIFISRQKILVFICTECQDNFFSYDDFFAHLCEQHYSPIEEDEELEEKYEPADVLEHEAYLDENLMIIMDQEEDDYKPLLTPTSQIDAQDILQDVSNKEESQVSYPCSLQGEYQIQSQDGSQDASQDAYHLTSEDATQDSSNDEITQHLNHFQEIDEYENSQESETKNNKMVTIFNNFSDLVETLEDELCNNENTEFKCSLCQKVFQTADRLRSHIKSHKKERKYKCDVCGFAFTEEFNLRTHMKRHNGVRQYACDQCDKRFITRNEVKAHQRTHTGERPYICEICGQTYVTSGSLNEHKKRHNNYRPHKCPECDKTFFDTGLLKEHMVVHSGERNHICQSCSATFTRRKALLQHMKLHSGIKQYKCDFCNKSFAQKPGLASHMKTHTKTTTLS